MSRLNRSILRVVSAWMLACGALFAPSAVAADLQDFVRVRGLEGDVLVGLGLVVGLDGTGDSMKDSTVAGQPYAQLLKTLGNISVTRQDVLKNKSVAIVYVSVEIPYGGARIGDRLDIQIATVGNAKSIEGGRLISTFLLTDVVPLDRSLWVPYAIAEGGPIDIDDNPTAGGILGAARVVRDIVKSPFEGETISLVLHDRYMGYPAATAIAAAINDELSLSGFSEAARVEDGKTIRVRIPEPDRATPNEFLGKLLTFAMPTDVIRLPSRIVIDMRNEVMTIDETVEFRPSAVTAEALRITSITPTPQATPENPIAETTAWTGLATGDEARKSIKLKDLIATLEQLEVPFVKQVAIVRSLEKQGALKAEILTR